MIGSALPSWNRSPSHGLELSGGHRLFDTASDSREDLSPGLKLAVLLEGTFSLQVDDNEFSMVQSATSTLFLSRQNWQLVHHFPEGTKLTYLTLFLEAGLIEDALEMALPESHSSPIQQAVHHISGAMSGLVSAILHRPLEGPAGRLYESAKALELAALALDTMVPSQPHSTASLASSAEVKRLYMLRDYLDSHWQHPLPADQLARQYGMGLRRMSIGFRRIFGCTISEYIREKRLQEAWKLLNGGLSATLVAEQIGYSLPHFTIAFQKRFGTTPGHLSRHGLS